ncbi:MAG: formate dehydrogenase subunit delta [Actinomycetota bacterium]
MNEQVMVHKANSIAQFFSSYPREEAIRSVAEHIERFWEPRMRRQLLDYAHRGGNGLHELVALAIQRLHPVPSDQTGAMA